MVRAQSQRNAGGDGGAPRFFALDGDSVLEMIAFVFGILGFIVAVNARSELSRIEERLAALEDQRPSDDTDQ